jgi:hypothetical protein
MVARTRSEAELLVIFSRNGETDEATIVANGERAAKVAVLMFPAAAPCTPAIN